MKSFLLNFAAIITFSLVGNAFGASSSYPKVKPDPQAVAPMFLNAVVVGIWMLAKGVDWDKWGSAIAAETTSFKESAT
jgi:hypothetical protein